jgi:5-methylcytosine-specific restriction endonuclease McrA
VAAARRLASDAVLAVVLTEGAEVTAVAHLGRSVPSRVRAALEARDPTCVVPGCDVRQGLEIDHRIPFAQGGPTTLDNLARLCRHHHYLKTHHRWRLGGGPGNWTWTGPDPPPQLSPR